MRTNNFVLTDHLFKTLIEKNYYSGALVQVCQNGTTIFKNKYGVASTANDELTYNHLFKSAKRKTLVYIDPPYLITTAPYNSGWNNLCEYNLYKWVTNLISEGHKIMLSNVISSNGKENNFLKNFVKKNNLKMLFIERRYLNSNYRKKIKDSQEVIVTNF